MLKRGNANELASALKGDDITRNPPVINILSGDCTDNITSKFGIDKSTASGIATSLIPIVLNKLVNKAKDPNDGSIDFSNILSSLQVNNSGNSNITSTISSVGTMLGFDKDKDGDVDLGDVFKMF